MEIPEQIELGCGKKKPEGFYGVDISETEVVDQTENLDQPGWDLPSDHFHVIRAVDLFEHLSNPTQFMEEVWRIAKPEAKIVIRGPHISSDNWHDPTHKRLLGSRTFEHYTPESRFEFYSDCSFKVNDFEIQFQWQPTPIKQIGHYVANRMTYSYETTALRNILPATNIRFELTPIKK
ncbi:methyltransferase domain-containing protein [Halobacterium sp. NMX12-1]|uniref:Methyltransferase domain-containing protein n=1 Tax=Halobacterium sp. NMX12-1 TaxID=3166650 RepID=A0AAU8C9Z0_9EURY